MTSILLPRTCLGSALVGGAYFAFSAIVMPALRGRSATDATAAMQAIDSRAERGPFISLFLGTAAAAVGLGAATLDRLPATGLEVATSALSVGSAIVTVAANVPLNRRLARQGSTVWPLYATRWSRWNSVRTLLALGAAAVGMAALLDSESS